MSDKSQRQSFSLFREREQNNSRKKNCRQTENTLFSKHSDPIDRENGDAIDTSQTSQTSQSSRRKSFNLFRGEPKEPKYQVRRSTLDAYSLQGQIAEVQNDFDEEEENGSGSTSNLSFHERKKTIQSQIKELKSLRHKEAASIKSKIEKIQVMNSKKSYYGTQLNATLNKLQVDVDKQNSNVNNNLVTIDIALGDSFESDIVSPDAAPMTNDSTQGGSKQPRNHHNAFHQAITAFVKPKKDEEIEELNELIELLMSARSNNLSLTKTLSLSLSMRESAISDLENIVHSQADVIGEFRKEIDNSNIDDSTNSQQSTLEDRYLSLSMQLNESQRSETQTAEDIKVMRQSMTTSIDKIKNLDKESETSTFECGKLGARNVFLRTNSVRIVDEVKTVYASKKNVEATVIQLRSYLGLIGNLESYFLKQISKFALEEEGMDAIVENVNFFLSVASEFNSMVQDTTVILELLEAVEGVHPEILEEENVYQLAQRNIKSCLSVEEPVVASLLSMKAILTLMLGSLSKDDEFFTSLETMREDIKVSIEKDSAGDKNMMSCSKPKNFLSVPDATILVMECKLNENCVEISYLEGQCQHLNATAERLLDFCDKNSITVM